MEKTFYMPNVGKYAGWNITNVPMEYLEWAFVNMEAINPQTRTAIAGWMNRHSRGEAARQPKAKPTNVRPKPVKADIIAAWCIYEEGVLGCHRCRGWEKMESPQNVSLAMKQIGAFFGKHSRCKE